RIFHEKCGLQVEPYTIYFRTDDSSSITSGNSGFCPSSQESVSGENTDTSSFKERFILRSIQHSDQKRWIKTRTRRREPLSAYRLGANFEHHPLFARFRRQIFDILSRSADRPPRSVYNGRNGNA